MGKLTIAAFAGTALLVAAPALSKPGGGQGGTPSGPPTTGQGTSGTHDHSTMGNQGPANASPMATERASANSPVSTTTTTPTTDATRRDQARTNSQGPANASTTGIANANENSVLAGGSVGADTLPGLTTGLNVQSNGTTLGTISEVVTGSDGSIRLIVVTQADGQTVRIPASQLSISDDVVTVITP